MAMAEKKRRTRMLVVVVVMGLRFPYIGHVAVCQAEPHKVVRLLVVGLPRTGRIQKVTM